MYKLNSIKLRPTNNYQPSKYPIIIIFAHESFKAKIISQLKTTGGTKFVKAKKSTQ